MMQSYDALKRYFAEFLKNPPQSGTLEYFKTHVFEIWQILWMGNYTEHQEFIAVTKTIYSENGLRVELTFADKKKYVILIQEVN